MLNVVRALLRASTPAATPKSSPKDSEARMRIATQMAEEWRTNEIKNMEAVNLDLGPCKTCGWFPYPAMETGDYWDWDHDSLADHPYLPLDK